MEIARVQSSGLSNGFTPLKPEKSESRIWCLSGGHEEEGKGQNDTSWPILIYFRVRVTRCPPKISSPEKELEHILLKTFLQPFVKVNVLKKENRGKDSPVWILYADAPQNRLPGWPWALDLFLQPSRGLFKLRQLWDVCPSFAGGIFLWYGGPVNNSKGSISVSLLTLYILPRWCHSLHWFYLLHMICLEKYRYYSNKQTNKQTCVTHQKSSPKLQTRRISWEFF